MTSSDTFQIGAAVTAPQKTGGRRGRRMAMHLMRFASVLVGAGLLFRVDAAERAVSAVEEDRSPGTLPSALTARTMPHPAFGRANTAAPMVTHAAPAAMAHIVQPSPAPSFAPGRGPALGDALRPEAALIAQAHRRTDAPAPAALAAPLGTSPRLQAHAPLASALVPIPAMTPAAAPAAPVAAPMALPVSQAHRAGLRTTPVPSHTTDIEAEMRRPASAWDYMENVAPEYRAAPSAAQPRVDLAPRPAAPASAPVVHAAQAAAAPVAALTVPSLAPEIVAPQDSGEAGADAQESASLRPENNIAPRAVRRDALAELAALAARTSPTNPVATASARNAVDRYPQPRF
ncbi:hypothetical protein OLX02_11395 [Novosphingobium sp. KCTC 2891]|uniref:hypothetical protein n=1 Tax=Novosphingobium sp. KCTC 2891 TaxID=2989730 RepID=UPI0022237327|nr:hypothetical protein [Novosphingobium sp. KCTC 2891]MCW1383425.1 hypothetical protein [Novosphingobium sp. KCTC 2891]